jgi:hypothetical protein
MFSGNRRVIPQPDQGGGPQNGRFWLANNTPVAKSAK